MNDPTKIIIRKFIPETDSGGIYASFPKGVWHSPAAPILLAKKQFFQSFYVYLRDLLSSAKVHIACLEQDPDTIIGYSIIHKHKLEWVCVKDLFRKQGLATLLCQNKGIESFNEDNLTKIGQGILKNHPNLFKKKEEEQQ